MTHDVIAIVNVIDFLANYGAVGRAANQTV